MPKSRFSAVFSLLLVFLSGALVGVLAHRAYVMKTATAGPPPPKKRDPADWRKHIVPEMKTELKLDDQQVSQLNRILDETDVRFRDVREKWNGANQAIQKDMVDKINGILRPDQRALYEQWRARREKERRLRMQQKREGPPPGPPPPGPPPEKR